MFAYHGKKLKLLIFHKSSAVDLFLFLLNNLLKITLFPIFIFSTLSVSKLLLKVLYPIFSEIYLDLTLAHYSLVLTFLIFILDDFAKFFQHYLSHKLKPLFYLHKTHHSAEVLTPLTLYRTHPIESFISLLRNTCVQGFTIALFTAMSHHQIQIIDILGVNALNFTFNSLLANLRHSHVPLSFGYFEYLIISPRMHQIHHSTDIEHRDKNFGVSLSLWDHLFGTFYRPKKAEMKSLRFA